MSRGRFYALFFFFFLIYQIEKGRANAALEDITATMRGATGQRGEMTNLKAETERESAELARRKVTSILYRNVRYE